MSKLPEKIDLLQFRVPLSSDGMSVHQLVADCKPLDENSVYCNLLQCAHFSQTGCCAEVNGELVGFVSAYIPPGQPDTLFIWQVAVSESARGKGLAGRMIRHILDRESCRQIRFIEATITPTNSPSWALFTRLAEFYQAELKRMPMFDRDHHFNGKHESEDRVIVGPIQRG